MRQTVINLYQFNELPEKIQEKLIEKHYSII